MKKQFTNICTKLNLRYRHTNYVLPDKKSDIGFGGHKVNTMILGSDMTHPGTSNLQGTPSIVAVVASVDSDFALMPGSMRLNPCKQEIIASMEGMVKERLMHWKFKNGKLPTSILFYRGGVGEANTLKSDVKRSKPFVLLGRVPTNKAQLLAHHSRSPVLLSRSAIIRVFFQPKQENVREAAMSTRNLCRAWNHNSV